MSSNLRKGGGYNYNTVGIYLNRAYVVLMYTYFIKQCLLYFP